MPRPARIRLTSESRSSKDVYKRQGLILLGGEVLFFAARPGRWKYDFWSVLICLVLMGGCFCLSLLPVVWDELGPEPVSYTHLEGQRRGCTSSDRDETERRWAGR